MQKNTPTTWNPLNYSTKASIYMLSHITDGPTKFEFVLSSIHEKNITKIKILFRKSTQAYKITRKKYDAETLPMIKLAFGTQFDPEWMFYTASESSYLEWIASESYDVWKPLGFIQFSFITSDMIIDVVASYEPEVMLINEL